MARTNAAVAAAIAAPLAGAPEPPPSAPPSRRRSRSKAAASRSATGRSRASRAIGRGSGLRPQADAAVLALSAALIQDLRLGSQPRRTSSGVGLAATDYVGRTYGPAGGDGSAALARSRPRRLSHGARPKRSGLCGGATGRSWRARHSRTLAAPRSSRRRSNRCRADQESHQRRGDRSNGDCRADARQHRRDRRSLSRFASPGSRPAIAPSMPRGDLPAHPQVAAAFSKDEIAATPDRSANRSTGR